MSVLLHVFCQLPILSFHSSRSNAFALRTEIVRFVSGFTLINHFSVEKGEKKKKKGKQQYKKTIKEGPVSSEFDWVVGTV